ncbi:MULTISPECIES: histidine phosphatase family protein [Corynebacterium]|uniref:Histidine phosphatase family protein n=1 Tax=Corynebacterium striatum TaxID=43770 RepID=A0ABC8CMU2_CORST|nr:MULTISPECIES: histidine phosphatase family protein [Corynebacterium]ATZ09349.1 histidine phosphatase family protein [Corynebacterium striatum]EGT5613117.1 histidine phosphatase family protein [Corynebacterium striatum]KAA1264588.1 histidine phosphatase family protein [Corynebacterium striatum]MBD0856939.1 histidine phosphatase family protein [Corynebacterium striatum]MDK8789356.1 histidine phosphatase family protein [Corynebacterium striatum]
MSTTIVHLVRHGEVYNPDKILYGRIPGYHLSSRGHSMAARTAEAFRGHDVTYLVASPLQRTQETAQPISKVTGLDVDVDKSVIESGNRFEGLRTKGWNSQLWNPQRWPLLRNPLQPSWGEPFEEIAARMMNAVERARQKAEGHEAIIVSHQLPIVMVQRTALGKRLAHAPWDRECDLASVTSLVFQDDQLIDIFYSSPAQAI